MTVELTTGTFTMEGRQGYLLVVHPGALATEEEVYVYSLAIEREAARHKVRRLLIDSRAEPSEERHEVRTALWRWLSMTRALDGIAIVARDTLAATRINMTALSQRLSIRAYDEPTTAVRWLTRGSGGKSTGSFKAMTSEDAQSVSLATGLRRASTPPPPAGPTPTDGVKIPSAAPVPKTDTRDSAVRERTPTPVPASERRRG